MVRVGLHVSIAGSIDKAVDRAVAGGCDTFQIFSRNPRGWRMKELSEPAVEKFIEKIKRSGIYPPVDHMPYLPNLASPKEDVYAKSLDALIAELGRCETLKIPYLVTHLGSHLGSGVEKGYQRVADSINTAFETVENDVMLLLENTAATKNSVGGSFEDIKAIMDRVDIIERVGVCFDTCHAFVAGYEIRTKEDLKSTLEHFDEVVGIEKLKLIHLNDAKADLGSKLDRHEHIGLGYIGEGGFRVILQNPNLKDLPMILETPVDERRDDLGNIRKVRELAD
ncbi:MAG: endonuclease IV [Candidatus Syntrophoarchaeum sp. GoM_oil]|nr:MAG: endonuclease IV [Candidatus Syntrophoarchaeum sp. GoM_oil]